MESTNATNHAFADGLAEDRVRSHTSAHVNEKIDALTAATVEKTASSGRDAIIRRLKDLDREWDVDRALIANFAVLGPITLELGRRYHRGWTYLLRAQMGFLLMHAVVGWCPPLPILRRLGFRTAKEIAAERSALLEHLETTPDAL